MDENKPGGADNTDAGGLLDYTRGFIARARCNSDAMNQALVPTTVATSGHNMLASIVEGRANGMPSWRGKIPDTQVWQLVAYVQSMSGNAPVPTLPGRSDHMRYSTPENARRAETPVQTGTP